MNPSLNRQKTDPYFVEYTDTNTCTHSHIFIRHTHTNITYVLAQPECGAVVILRRPMWFSRVCSALVFLICALFIHVHIFTEPQQYLPMLTFYRVQARKLKWNDPRYRRFFSAGSATHFLIFCAHS